jgi:hypothetical protein
MRAALFSLVVCLVACGSNDQHGVDICKTMIPAPAACMTACNPMPGAANTCPVGYHCTGDGKCDAQCTVGGSQCGDGFFCTNDGTCQGSGQCVGLECKVAKCESMNKPATTISGTVYAPNGTLPLYGVTVYVPNSNPGTLPDGAQCSKCTDTLPGDPVVQTSTDEAGHFTLTDAPSGANIPIVIVSGKWRRQVMVSNVTQCADNPMPASDTRLPKNHTEGDIPLIAISTGHADSLECLIRKLGVDDAEIGKNGGSQRVHLYTDTNSQGKGVSAFSTGFAGGTGNFTDSASTLWDSVAHLTPYDIVILSCEGGQYPNTKPQTAMDALKKYADLGGRVFLSHWHNIWVEGATDTPNNGQKPAVWTGVASWSNSGGNLNDPAIDLIDEANNPKGSSFATWMLNVMGSTVRDQIPLQTGTGRATCDQVDNTKGERWTYVQNQGGTTQNFQFTTPNELSADQRCGKVAFSDMHVSGGPGTGNYPDSCQGSTDLTPQEKALAFMLFDLSSCVGSLF